MSINRPDYNLSFLINFWLDQYYIINLVSNRVSIVSLDFNITLILVDIEGCIVHSHDHVKSKTFFSLGFELLLNLNLILEIVLLCRDCTTNNVIWSCAHTHNKINVTVSAPPKVIWCDYYSLSTIYYLVGISLLHQRKVIWDWIWELDLALKRIADCWELNRINKTFCCIQRDLKLDNVYWSRFHVLSNCRIRWVQAV